MTWSSNFIPANEAHAVVETVFFFEFEKKLIKDSVVSNVLAERLQPKLPKFESTPSFEINFDVASGTVNPKSVAGSFAFMSEVGADDLPAWVIRINDEQVSIHCTDYTRWDNISEEAFGFLREIFKSAESDIKIMSVGLKVLDRFKYVGDKKEYNLSSLFSVDTKLVPELIFESSDRWHATSGWFPQTETKEPLLNQLHLASAGAMTTEGEMTFVSVDHTLVLRKREEGNSQPLATANEESISYLRSIYKTLHFDNKKLLVNLLTQEMTETLNLTVGEHNV